MPPPPSTRAPDWRVEPRPVPYADALAAMETRVAAIRAGTAPELVWLLEHPPTYTAGTSATPAGLRDARFPTARAGRGGEWTYHGPGQRVAYVLLDLDVRGRDIRAHVNRLEAWLVAALAMLGVHGERRPGRIGIWVVPEGVRGTIAGAEAKVAAIGVRVTRWVTWHGVAVNVSPDLSHFDGIVPCGLADHGVTSLAALGVPATMAQLDTALRATWTAAF